MARVENSELFHSHPNRHIPSLSTSIDIELKRLAPCSSELTDEVDGSHPTSTTLARFSSDLVAKLTFMRILTDSGTHLQPGLSKLVQEKSMSSICSDIRLQ
jgi:hypothetical protein